MMFHSSRENKGTEGRGALRLAKFCYCNLITKVYIYIDKTLVSVTFN